MKTNWKQILTVLLALVLVLGLMLVGCDQPEQPTQPSAESQPTQAAEPAEEAVKLYWNVDGATYRGDPKNVPVRKLGSDGYYSVKFAVDGEQKTIKVTPEAMSKGVDMVDVLRSKREVI